MICSVFPDRSIELDVYLVPIGDLNIRYWENIFYQYRKAFSCKAALCISQSNIWLNWSILDSEILIMLAEGSRALSYSTCGNIL